MKLEIFRKFINSPFSLNKKKEDKEKGNRKPILISDFSSSEIVS